MPFRRQPQTTFLDEVVEAFRFSKDIAPSSSVDVSENRIRAIRLVLGRTQKRTALIDALRADDPLGSNLFYPRLVTLIESLGESSDSIELTADVWAESLRGSEQSEVETSLSDFQFSGRPFWRLLPSLGRVISRLTLTPQFVFNLLKSLAIKVAKDFMQGHFWLAAFQLVKYCPDLALSMLEQIRLEDPTDFHLAQFFIGTLRHLPMDAECNARFVDVAQTFSSHRSVEYRTAFLDSWATTAIQAGISQQDLLNLWRPFADSSATEKQRTIYVVAHLLTSGFLSDSVKELGHHWLLQNASSVINAEARCSILMLVHHVVASGDESLVRYATQHFHDVLPLPPDDNSSWNVASELLYRLLGRDINLFFGILEDLSDHNLNDVLLALRDPDKLEWVVTELSRQDAQPIVSRLILNQSLPKRKLGLLLFDELELECLSPDGLATASDNEIRLAFLQTQCSMYDAKALARLFASLLSRFELMGNDDQIAFFSEVELQCRNRGGTAVELQKLVGDNSRLKELLKSLSAEASQSKVARQSSICKMGIPGYNKAGRKHQLRFSHETSEMVGERSVVFRLFKQTKLLYANKHSAVLGESLCDASTLRQFSHSVEIPIVDYADPEGMTIRRWQAGQSISIVAASRECEESA